MSRYVLLPDGRKVLVGGTDQTPEMTEAEAHKLAADMASSKSGFGKNGGDK